VTPSSWTEPSRAPRARAAPIRSTRTSVRRRRQGQGRNGIVVWKADHVSIENMTACNFLGGAGDSGTNSGGTAATAREDRPDRVHGELPHRDHVLLQQRDLRRGVRHLLVQLAGPSSWNQIYGSNMNDSGMYVGACHQVCEVTIDHAWMENNALGYSGTNSGGAVVIENSQFDNNQTASTPTPDRRRPPPPRTGRAGWRHQLHHAHPLVLGVHPQQRA